MSEKVALHFSSLLRRFVSASEIPRTRQTHVQLLIHGFLSHTTLQTDLLRAYSKCGLLSHARKVFDVMLHRNMHSWNILIFSYVQISMFSLAFSLFDSFKQTNLRPDHYTLPPLLKASAAIGDSFRGRALYAMAMRLGIGNCVVVNSSFLDFCVKCGSFVDAKRVFLAMPYRDCVAWNSMISGLGRAGFYSEALGFFSDMIRADVEIDSMTIPSVLSSCGREGELTKGREIHGRASKILSCESDLAVGNSLIDMYGKCGSLDEAEKLFRYMNVSNHITWTTMMSCYGAHGKGEFSLLLYQEMTGLGFKPNCVTFTAVLSGCSHSGLVNEGRRIFNSIKLVYGFEPSVEHYACMVDLLGRFGYLEEALKLTMEMKTSVPATVWGALLAGCVTHKNVEIGEIAANKLFELEPKNPSNYIALCGIYDSLKMRDRVSLIRTKMRKLRLVKTPGCSWINILGTSYRFYQGDCSDRITSFVYEMVDNAIKTASLAGDCSEEDFV